MLTYHFFNNPITPTKIMKIFVYVLVVRETSDGECECDYVSVFRFEREAKKQLAKLRQEAQRLYIPKEGWVVDKNHPRCFYAYEKGAESHNSILYEIREEELIY